MAKMTSDMLVKRNVMVEIDNKKAGGLMAQLKECYYTTIL